MERWLCRRWRGVKGLYDEWLMKRRGAKLKSRDGLKIVEKVNIR